MAARPPRAHPEAATITGPGPVPELGETLRVVSKDTVTLRFQWNSRVYPLPPGGECHMPFDAVKCYTGDPRATAVARTVRDSIGIVSFLPDRETEVRRLRLLYMAPFGEYMAAENAGGIFQSVRNEHHPLGSHAFEGVRIPQVEVYNIANERILTVLDDPDGDNVIPIPTTSAREAQLEHAMAQQQSVISVMAKRLGIDPETGGLLNAPNVTNDYPEEPDEPLDITEPVPGTRDPVPGSESLYNEDGIPRMVYDQRSHEIRPKRPKPPIDPSTISDIPEDKI